MVVNGDYLHTSYLLVCPVNNSRKGLNWEAGQLAHNPQLITPSREASADTSVELLSHVYHSRCLSVSGLKRVIRINRT
jgi:hypothetical protein